MKRPASSRELARQRNQKDACPNVEMGPDPNGFKLTHITLNKVKRHCCACNPGKKVTQLCQDEQENIDTTVCESCEEGTYIDEYHHNRTSCSPQIKECPSDRNLVVGNASRASSCHCKEGLYESQSGRCEPHRSCGQHYGVVRCGDPFNDTECQRCRPGYDSLSNSPTERCTYQQLHTAPRIDNFPTTVQSVAPTTSSYDAIPTPTGIQTNFQQGLPPVAYAFIGIGSVLSLIVVVLIAIAVWRNRGQQREANGRRHGKVHYSGGNSREEGYAGKGKECTSLLNTVEHIAGNDNDLNMHGRAGQDRNAHQHMETMKAIKGALCEEMHSVDTYRMYRKFTTKRNPELFIEDLRQINSYSERFHKVFSELQTQAPDSFSPQNLYDFFIEISLQRYADIIEQYLG